MMDSIEGFPQGCNYCDGSGGEKTLKHQVCLPINGRVQCINFCIHNIV